MLIVGNSNNVKVHKVRNESLIYQEDSLNRTRISLNWVAWVMWDCPSDSLLVLQLLYCLSRKDACQPSSVTSPPAFEIYAPEETGEQIAHQFWQRCLSFITSALYCQFWF